MDVNEVLQFVDRLVFEQTGKHLDDVQKSIVEGTWQRQTYDNIAHECHVNKNYASDVGAELWEILSQALGEDIKKTNFRSTLERVYIESSKNSNIYLINGANNNHFYKTQILNNTNNNLKTNINSQDNLPKYDLNLTPKIINFYNRESELKALSSWILDNNIRLISVL